MSPTFSCIVLTNPDYLIKDLWAHQIQKFITIAYLIKHLHYLKFLEELFEIQKQTSSDSTSTPDNELLYQGRRYDTETNLYYYRARYFDPIMGRFLQTDPKGYKDSMNLYQAFNMNGMNFVDPMGKAVEAIILKIRGPNELKNKSSAELGKVPKLGPKYKWSMWGYVINVMVLFTDDDSGEYYDPYQTAFVIYPNTDNIDPSRPGKAREIMIDNPDERYTDRYKDKLIWGDNPGLKPKGVNPRAFKGGFYAVFSATVKPKEGSPGKPTDKIIYFEIGIRVISGKIVKSVAREISKGKYDQKVKQYEK